MMAAKEEKTAAVVLAAGKGKRMNSHVQKQYLFIYDKPVIYYTLKAFEESEVDEVILVTGHEEVEYCRHEIVETYGFKKISKIVSGGKERFDSVYEGLRAVSDCDYVLIHDGARPFITPGLINDNIACVKKTGACVTAVPSKDTVKIGDEEGFIKDTPARSLVWMIQTPQSFRYKLILEAYQKRAEANDNSVTDDAMVVEKYAHQKIRLLMGDYRNIKITTPEDMVLAEAFLKEKLSEEKIEKNKINC